jgi:hypothetical protein
VRTRHPLGRTRHPLLHPFPLTVLALGAILIAFAFSMAAFGDGDADLHGANAGIARGALSQTP